MENMMDEYNAHRRGSMSFDDLVAYARDMLESVEESKKEGMMTVGQASRLEELMRFLSGWLEDNRSPVGPKVCGDCEDNEVRK